MYTYWEDKHECSNDEKDERLEAAQEDRPLEASNVPHSVAQVQCYKTVKEHSRHKHEKPVSTTEETQKLVWNM